jgi:hypothetical protein
VEPQPGEWSRLPHTSVYCLVPEALADELLAPLRAHYRCDPDVKVIADRRKTTRPSESDSATIDDGRAHSDRRRPVVPRDLAAALPPALAARAEDLRWEQRLRPVRRRLQDTPLEALLGLIVDGDDDAHSELYWRYANRVRWRLARRLADRRQLDAATKRSFGRLFDAIVHRDPGSRSFDAFVAAVADAVARECITR